MMTTGETSAMHFNREFNHEFNSSVPTAMTQNLAQFATNWSLNASRIGFILTVCLGNAYLFHRLPSAMRCPGCSVVTGVSAVNIVHSLIMTLCILLDGVSKLPGSSMESPSCLVKIGLLHFLSFIQLVNFVYLLMQTVASKLGKTQRNGTTWTFMPLVPFVVVPIVYYICVIVYLTTEPNAAFIRKSTTLFTFSTSDTFVYEMDINMVICQGDMWTNLGHIVNHYVLLVVPCVVVVVACCAFHLCYRQTVEPSQGNGHDVKTFFLSEINIIFVNWTEIRVWVT
jgi:hypothetical protein